MDIATYFAIAIIAVAVFAITRERELSRFEKEWYELQALVIEQQQRGTQWISEIE